MLPKWGNFAKSGHTGWHLIAPPPLHQPQTSWVKQVYTLPQALFLFIMIVRLTVCWRPMCCWLRLKCTGNGDPSKAILWVLSKREEKNFFFKKWTNPDLFFVYFRTFQTNIIKIFTTDQCEKISCPSSISTYNAKIFILGFAGNLGNLSYSK